MVKVKGAHIVVEGADGSGKSTVVRTLTEKYKKAGFDVEMHGNPGGTPLGQELRSLVKNRKDLTIDDQTIQILMMADWCCYLNTVVNPGVEAGKIIISDRANVVSGICYGLASDISITKIEAMQAVLPQAIHPIHVILLTTHIDTLLTRQHHDITVEGVTECRFQNKGKEFLFKVLRYYGLLAKIVDSRHKITGYEFPSDTIEYCVNKLFEKQLICLYKPISTNDKSIVEVTRLVSSVVDQILAGCPS